MDYLEPIILDVYYEGNLKLKTQNNISREEHPRTRRERRKRKEKNRKKYLKISIPNHYLECTDPFIIFNKENKETISKIHFSLICVVKKICSTIPEIIRGKEEKWLNENYDEVIF